MISWLKRDHPIGTNPLAQFIRMTFTLLWDIELIRDGFLTFASFVGAVFPLIMSCIIKEKKKKIKPDGSVLTTTNNQLHKIFLLKSKSKRERK